MIFETFEWFTAFFLILTTYIFGWVIAFFFYLDHTAWYLTLLVELQLSFQSDHTTWYFTLLNVTAFFSILTSLHDNWHFWVIYSVLFNLDMIYDIWHFWVSHSILFNLDHTTWYLTLLGIKAFFFNRDHTIYWTLLGDLERSF